MRLMKAMQVPSPGADFELVERPIPTPQPGEVLVRVEACGICHGDSLVKEGGFPGLTYPRVPGHEVVGTIEAVDPESPAWRVGQRVGVGWHGGHCFHCSACRRGDFGACDSALTTGLSADGGYAEYMVAHSEALVAIPNGLDPVFAAPLLCAGSTTLSALKNSGAKAGDLVAVHGLGGLGHLAVQFASRLGFRTVALSRGREKEALARELGAHAYVDTTAGDAAKELRNLGGAQVILCTAPDANAISQLVGGLGPRGRLVILTFVDDPIVVSPAQLMRGGKGIVGWVGGSPEDALSVSVLTGVLPRVEAFPLEQAAVAYERMMSAKVLFRAVLTMGGQYG